MKCVSLSTNILERVQDIRKSTMNKNDNWWCTFKKNWKKEEEREKRSAVKACSWQRESPWRDLYQMVRYTLPPWRLAPLHATKKLPLVLKQRRLSDTQRFLSSQKEESRQCGRRWKNVKGGQNVPLSFSFLKFVILVFCKFSGHLVRLFFSSSARLCVGGLCHWRNTFSLVIQRTTRAHTRQRQIIMVRRGIYNIGTFLCFL